MRLTKLLLAIALLSVAGLGNAWTDHGHGRRGVHLGVVIGPYWSPWYTPLPYYYYPTYNPPVIVERPSIYIEQQSQALPPPSTAAVPSPAQQTNYWYYCGATKAYYPYAQECPSGWLKVSPHPPGQP